MRLIEKHKNLRTKQVYAKSKRTKLKILFGFSTERWINEREIEIRERKDARHTAPTTIAHLHEFIMWTRSSSSSIHQIRFSPSPIYERMHTLKLITTLIFLSRLFYILYYHFHYYWQYTKNFIIPLPFSLFVVMVVVCGVGSSVRLFVDLKF